MSDIRRIAVNTGGGDAPGLNAVIHSTVYAARNLGWEVIGIREGYDGLLFPERFKHGGTVSLHRNDVRNIAHLGGTILGTTNRGNPFHLRVRKADGTFEEVDRSDDVIAAFKKNRIDALVAIGGDGSLTIAQGLLEKGLRVVGVPKTIDNDLQSTVLTFGFDSAVTFATECIDRLHSTAASHRRVMVVEVMGRYAGWIALNAGIAGRADAILIPEIPFDAKKLAAHIEKKTASSRSYAIVVVAEGARPMNGRVTVTTREPGGPEVLGGVGELVTKEIQQLTGKEARTVVLGHLLRGGSPTATDRMLGLTFGAAAVRALAEGLNGVMVAIVPPHIRFVPLKEAIATMKQVPIDGDGVTTARTLDISFGDR